MPTLSAQAVLAIRQNKMIDKNFPFLAAGKAKAVQAIVFHCRTVIAIKALSAKLLQIWNTFSVLIGQPQLSAAAYVAPALHKSNWPNFRPSFMQQDDTARIHRVCVCATSHTHNAHILSTSEKCDTVKFSTADSMHHINLTHNWTHLCMTQT